MKSVIFGLVLSVFASVECRNRWGGLKDGPYEVGVLLDKFLVEVNDKLTADNIVSYELQDFSIGGAVGKDVTIGKLNTLVRRGPAIIANKGYIFIANVTLGLKEMSISVDSFTYKGKTAPVRFDIADNAVLMAYSVDIGNKINCSLSWNAFQLVEFNDVTTSSPEPSFNNGDVSRLFSTTVKAYLNRLFATNDFLNKLDDIINPCKYKTMSSDPLAQLHRLIYLD